MLAAICSGVCRTGACGVDSCVCGGALGVRGFLEAAGFFLGGSATGSSSGGGSFSTIGSSGGICSVIFGLFFFPGGRPRLGYCTLWGDVFFAFWVQTCNISIVFLRFCIIVPACPQ